MSAIHRWESGFTLIEMMVVLTIICILSAIATVTLGTSSSRAYVTAMQADLRNVVTAQEAFIEEAFAATGRATTRCAVFRGTIKAFPPATDEGKINCD